MDRRNNLVIITCLCLLMLVLPGSAANTGLNTIAPGGDVFLGEQGLDISACVGNATQLAWFSGSTPVANGSPTDIMTVGDPRNFYVAQSTFGERLYQWYQWNGAPPAGPVAFTVRDPEMTLAIFVQGWANKVYYTRATQGDILNFYIRSNMYTMTWRPGFNPAVNSLWTIKVESPDGTVYTALFNNTTSQIPLTGITTYTYIDYWVPTSALTTGWNTGVSREGSMFYKGGKYKATVECNVNGIKDNYHSSKGTDYLGKTISIPQSVYIISDRVRLYFERIDVGYKLQVPRNIGGVPVAAMSRGNQFALNITGRGNTGYLIWVKGTNQMTGGPDDQPPTILPYQDQVTQDDPNVITLGNYQYQNGAGRTVQQDVPTDPAYNSTNRNGTVYYGLIQLDGYGYGTIGFQTTNNTKGKKYTFHIERGPPGPNGFPPIWQGLTQYYTDEVDLFVDEGSVTVVAAGTQNYFLGEEIKLTGTNSETDNTYLFITGPNLPLNGGQMTDPRTAVDPSNPSTFAPSDVVGNSTWEYKWQTANLNLDAGTYTIYAVATPDNKDNLANAQYATVSVIIRKPFISAQASQPVVAAGDKIFIRGTAAGQPTEGIAVWVLGKNKVIYSTTSVNADGTFEYEVSQGTTAAMDAGQYFVVAQHPMYNEIFDVWPAASVGGSGNKDLAVGSYPISGNTLFTLQGPGSLQGSDAAEALVQALTNPSVDDTYAKLQFLVEVPKITVLPVGEKQVGEKFNVAGTTNLAIDDELLVEVTSSSFKPTEKTQSGEFSGATGSVKVRKGADGLNTWSFPVDAAAFKPDEYIVTANAVTVSSAQASTLFNVVEFKPTPVPATSVATATVITQTTTAMHTAIPTTQPTKQPGFGPLVALAGLGVVAYVARRKP